MTAGAVLVLIPSRLSGRHTISGLAKMTASTGFLWTAFEAGGASTGAYGLVVLAGLSFGWLGDLLLIPKRSKRAFLAGLSGFLLGHAAFVVAISLHGFSTRNAAAVLAFFALFGVFFFHWLPLSRDSAMRMGIAAYIAVITVMLAVGVATWGTGAFKLLVPGSALFYASDIGVALDRFAPTRFPAYIWSLPLYYGGQTCFALSAGFRS